MVGELIDRWSSWPEIWLVVGLALCLLELPTGVMIAFPLGLAAGIVSTYLFAQSYLPDTLQVDDWRVILLGYALLAVVSVWLLRRVFQRRQAEQPDVNKY